MYSLWGRSYSLHLLFDGGSKTRTKVVVIMHVFELKKPSNSARLLPVCLENAEVLVRGEKDRPMPTTSLEDPDQSYGFSFPVMTQSHLRRPSSIRPLSRLRWLCQMEHGLRPEGSPIGSRSLKTHDG